MTTTRRTFLALTAPCVGALVVPKVAEARPRLTKGRMEELFEEIQCWDERVVHIWIHPSFESQFRAVLGNDTYDVDTHWQLRNRGIVGFLWGATVFVSRKVPYGEVLCVSGAKADSGEDRRRLGPSEADIEAADRRWMVAGP